MRPGQKIVITIPTTGPEIKTIWSLRKSTKFRDALSAIQYPTFSTIYTAIETYQTSTTGTSFLRSGRPEIFSDIDKQCIISKPSRTL